MLLPIGTSVTLHLLINFNGLGVPGLSPTVIFQRLSDNLYWNGTTAFTSTLVRVPLTQVDSVNQPGNYAITFNQSIDNTAEEYCAYYSSGSLTYPGDAVEEILFSNIEADVNTTAIASAVASKILVNPAIQINSGDIASQATLLSIGNEVTYIEENMALESTLLSGLTVIENDLNTIISIIQPLAGSNEITFLFTDQNSLPVPGVKISVKDTAGLITLAVGFSDINGQLTLGLPPGSFSILFYKAFISFPTQPYDLVVTGNAVVDISCTTFSPTAPTINGCAAYVYLTDASGAPIANIMFRAKAVSSFPYSPGSSMLVTKDYISCISNASGYVQLNLIQGAWYELSSPSLFFTVTDWQCPPVSSLDLSTLLNVSS